MVTRWTAADGLPSNALTNALQTADGYLWLASFDNLSRFDGQEFAVFDKRSVPALAANGLHELLESADGELWLGTRGAGVVVYRGGGFEPLA